MARGPTLQAALCIAGALALGGYALLLREPAHAAAPAPTAVTVRGVDVTRGDANALALQIARSFLRESIEVRVEGAPRLVKTREELGARVDVARLSRLIEDTRDARSPIRRVHGRINGVSPLTIPLPVELDLAQSRDLFVALKDEVDQSPLDARLDLATHTVRPERVGRLLDVYGSLDALLAALRADAHEVTLAVETQAPHRVARDLAAIDVGETLGVFETHYNTLETARDRSFNLHVAADKIDGLVVMPGETFDFNALVGERSEANGFRVAPVIAEGELSEGVGGGTCQIAGTLHAAVFFAGLPIPTREPHSRPSFYIRMGLDAMVSYPDMNLRFTNDQPFPIAIQLHVGYGIVHAELRGAHRSRMVTFVRRIDDLTHYEHRETADPTLPTGVRVLAQRGIPGFSVTRFRVTRDVAHNQAVRERMHDVYPPTTEIFRVGTGGAAPPGFVRPADDAHPEYLADEYLVVTEGVGVDGIEESRRAGRTATPGWTRAFDGGTR